MRMRLHADGCPSKAEQQQKANGIEEIDSR